MGLCGSGTLWITGECLYLCLSKCQHFVPYKQFKIYRFKQVYGALCKPNHHKMYRYWEIHVKILCIMWMRSQGASSSTTIIQPKKKVAQRSIYSYQSKNLHRWFKIWWKKYIPKTQIQGVSSHRCQLLFHFSEENISSFQIACEYIISNKIHFALLIKQRKILEVKVFGLNDLQWRFGYNLKSWVYLY